jgi:peptide/nickel transport system permease protein
MHTQTDPKNAPLAGYSSGLFRGMPPFAITVVALFCLAAIFAAWISPHDPNEQNFLTAMSPPIGIGGGHWAHPLGTDNLGRDLLSRIIHGARVSLIIAVFAILIAGAVGTFLGLMAGYFGGIADAIVMRIVDAFLAVPFVLMAMGLVAAIGASLTNLILVMALTNWARYARLVRSESLSVRTKDYVLLAQVAGLPGYRIALRHVLPNVANSVGVLATLDLGRVIILESSLSFLGLGIQPPNVSWGLMLADGRSYMDVAWWITVIPGLTILITVLSLNVFGDWLRDRLDPQARRD